MIVYGLLDSHTLLSAASSVRLDSFVYTIEGLREAREKLKRERRAFAVFQRCERRSGEKLPHDAGGLRWQGADLRLCRVRWLIYFPSVKHGDLSIPRWLIGQRAFTDGSPYYRNTTVKVDLSTDDWPFFYMPRRVYPASYLTAMGLILLLLVRAARELLPTGSQTSHLAFFSLGQDLCWSETKAITELGLAFGNTWQVIAIAMASILDYGLPGQRRGSVFAAEQSLPGLSAVDRERFRGLVGLPVRRPASTVAGRIGTVFISHLSSVFLRYCLFYSFFLLNAGFRVRCR